MQKNGGNVRLLELIPVSPERVKMPELAKKLGASERRARKMVLRARIEGVLIASDNNGYFRPATTGELMQFYIMMRTRAISCLRSLKEARRQLKEAGVDIAAIEGRRNERKRNK